MSTVLDIKKFCVDLYETAKTISYASSRDLRPSIHDFLHAAKTLKTHWNESTEGKQYAKGSVEERARLGNDVTRLYDILEEKNSPEFLTSLAELYSKAAWIQTGHLLTPWHSKDMQHLGECLQQLDEFTSLPTDLRASVEVAHERFMTGEKTFSSELHIWFDEVFASLDLLVKKLSSTDKAVVGSAVAKAKKKIALEFGTGLSDLTRIEGEMVLLQHEISEHMHRRGGEKSLREADPESVLLSVMGSVKKNAEELKQFVKSGQVKLNYF